MAIAAIAAGAGIVKGAVDTFSAMHDKKNAQSELDNLSIPFYKVQNEFYQNNNLAAQQAQSGLTTASKDFLSTENQRGVGAGVSAILSSGGSAGDISKLFDSYSRSSFNAAAADSEAQQKNIQYYMDTNKDLAGQKITQWSLNEYQPYENKLKQLTERLGAAKLNISGGVNTAIGSLSAYGTATSNNSLIASEIGKNNSQADVYKRMFAKSTDPFATSIGNVGNNTSESDYVNNPALF